MDVIVVELLKEFEAKYVVYIGHLNSYRIGLARKFFNRTPLHTYIYTFVISASSHRLIARLQCVKPV